MSENPAGRTESSLRTPLYDVHLAQGARMVDFAGYSLPVQFSSIMTEHKATREEAGLFDVSHMGQVRVEGEGALTFLESLVPGDLAALAPGQMRYTQFTNAAAGILDDLIVTRTEDGFFLVVNGACKHEDLAHMQAHKPVDVAITHLQDHALIALQGPKAVDVLRGFVGDLSGHGFMTAWSDQIDGIDVAISRSGYTGEDGFEISIPAVAAAGIADILLADGRVSPVGLGARDSLRLESGLCLYGHDLDPTTTPAEAGLMWSISKRRRADGGFPGADILAKQLEEKPARRRVGLALAGRAPAREGADILDQEGAVIGRVTSGGFAPTLGRPIAMGYIDSRFAAAETEVGLLVRNKTLEATVCKMPFVPQNYYRG